MTEQEEEAKPHAEIDREPRRVHPVLGELVGPPEGMPPFDPSNLVGPPEGMPDVDFTNLVDH